MSAHADPPVLTVSELTGTLKRMVRGAFPGLAVQGEISNFSRPASGHWYFTLKDDAAQLRCAMFRNANRSAGFTPANGDQVTVRGNLDIYTGRGELQMIVEAMTPAGEGALLAAFEALKRKLAAEGLFDPEQRRPLPKAPRGIGLITSDTGAAVRDVLSTLARRYPLAPVWLMPVPVQGSAAAPAIVRALSTLPDRAPVDVVLLVRGGGSLEDLWAFNEEIVARAIRACAVPVVTGVGHETDTTIADFAADLRAPTPTGAAELVTPDMQVWRDRLDILHAQLQRHLGLTRDLADQRLERAARALRRCSPLNEVRLHAQRVDELGLRLRAIANRDIRDRRSAIDQRARHLMALHPRRQLIAHQQQLQQLSERLRHATRLRLQRNGDRLERMQAMLAQLGPERTLARGYAIATDASGQLIRNADSAPVGSQLKLRLASGTLSAEVIDSPLRNGVGDH
jgi:exodeoxyribonuclease VII large subunit